MKENSGNNSSNNNNKDNNLKKEKTSLVRLKTNKVSSEQVTMQTINTEWVVKANCNHSEQSGTVMRSP